MCFLFNMLLFVTHFHTRPYRIVENFIKTCGLIKIHQAGSALWFQQQRLRKHKGIGID
jgi:hypothetical protein